MQEINYQSSLFYKNIKSYPPKDLNPGSEYLQLAKWEKEKCLDGINIGGIHLPGTLYYSLNHSYIDVEQEDGTMAMLLPTLRDTDWEIHKAYNEAKEHREGLIMGSLRQIGKSTLLATLATHELFLKEKSEVVALFATKTDRESFTKKLQNQLTYNTEFLVVPNIDKDLTRTDVRFGFKTADNSVFTYSQLFMLLTDEGRNTQISAGKLLPNKTKVFYQGKEGNIEDCRIGDRIFGKDGKLTTILGVYPQTDVKMFEMTLSDGRKIVSCEDHLWTVERIDWAGSRNQTLSTKELFHTYKRSWFNSKTGEPSESNRYKILKHKCLNYKAQAVTIDPYYLGIFLGDGTALSPNIFTNIEPDVIKYCNDYAISLGCTLISKGEHHRISTDLYINPLNQLFRGYNLIGNKHIPDAYFYNSKEIRLELLRGIMDTDGTIDTTGRIELCLSDGNLVTDCIKLIRSLGINCSVTESEASYRKNGVYFKCKNRFRIYLGTVAEEIVFNCPRKIERQNKRNTKISMQYGVSIVNIVPVENGDGVCLEVNNKDKLFLAGDFIPTHNTTTMALFDEIAKEKMKLVHEALIPALKSQRRDGGLRASPVYVFTGGQVEKGRDAKKVFDNPKTYYFREFGKEKKGFFLPGEYHGSFKKESTFGEYLVTKEGVKITDKEIAKMPMQVTDWEFATAELDREEAEAFKVDVESYTARKMYFPRNTSDIFISGENNIFSHLHGNFEKLLVYLDEKVRGYEVVDFEEQNGKVITVPSKKKILTEFPTENLASHELDAGVVILSHPRYVRGTKLYVEGADVYNVDKTGESPSLGSWYIIQREVADYTDPFNDRIVAYYNGRTDIKRFRQTLLLAMKYYGAEVGAITLLHEAADDNTTQWFDDKKLAFMLEDTYTLNKEITPNSKANNAKGLRPTLGNQTYYLGRLLEYCEEELPDGKLGLWRIPDPYLVRQCMNFDGNLGDKDAIVGMGHALTHLYKEKKFLRPLQTTDTPEEESRKRKERKSAFGVTSFKGARKRVI